ncbi:MAG: FAD/NAD(P)-binding protein [Thermodesulfovibrionales bacterium]|nr:FAD/NAD(P)-binding protein [Thermodesulfovibrionales bacterium]
MNANNVYTPSEALIEEVITLSRNVNLYTVKTKEEIKWLPGQFFMVSVFGFGEAPISVTSSAREPLKFCIKKVGHVTGAIHGLRAGDTIGIRGPYGNAFPLDVARGRDVVIIAGGLGIAPLRPLIHEFMENGKDYARVFLLSGSKTPADVIYSEECALWEKRGIRVTLTVDCPDDSWDVCTGLVTAHLDKVEADFQNAASYICGPEVMIEAAMKAVSARGIPEERIITTLEAHMKCGVGKCGHCYMGPKYICTDGPVFSYKELRRLAERFGKGHGPQDDPMWGY